MTTATLDLTRAIAIAHTLDHTLPHLPRAKLEGVSLKVIRQHFAEWFPVTVSALMAAPTEAEKKTLLGAVVDYRTRAVQGRLRKEMNLDFEEEFVKIFRHAVMTVLRDEAYAQGTPGGASPRPTS